jgi:hypothetical protein
MVWQMYAPGRYRVNVNGKKHEVLVPKDRLLKLNLQEEALKPLRITVTRI